MWNKVSNPCASIEFGSCTLLMEHTILQDVSNSLLGWIRYVRTSKDIKIKNILRKLVYAWLFSEGCLIVKHIKQDAFDFCKLSSGTLPATHQGSNSPWNILGHM